MNKCCSCGPITAYPIQYLYLGKCPCLGLGRTSGNTHYNAYCASILFLTSKGHSWRMSGDSRYSLPNYSYFTSLNFYRSPTWSYIISIINTNVAHISSIKFGAHNDMDMMEIGNPLDSFAENESNYLCIKQETVHLPYKNSALILPHGSSSRAPSFCVFLCAYYASHCSS